MHEAVVIGASAGGLSALERILSQLPESFFLPIIIVQHIAQTEEFYLPILLDNVSKLAVKEAEIGESPQAYTVYIAPPAYHLLIEPDRSFSLSIDPGINFSRPSIDVLFESAADVYRDQLIGIVLTGANSDGSAGLKAIKDHGGLTIVQDPKTAEISFMPQAAIHAAKPDYIADLDEIAQILIKLNLSQEQKYGTGTHR